MIDPIIKVDRSNRFVSVFGKKVKKFAPDVFHHFLPTLRPSADESAMAQVEEYGEPSPPGGDTGPG